jgi:hypothetical protein
MLENLWELRRIHEENESKYEKEELRIVYSHH